MTIAEFLWKWQPGGSAHDLNERSGAQQHFMELCEVLGVPTPDGSDDYRFERSTVLASAQRGFADVFKRGAFAWEYKAPGGNLDAALRQLLMYALALDNPPLLIVSDRVIIEIHTHFNGTPSKKYHFKQNDLTNPAKRELLRRAFTDPESFRPKRSSREITQAIADTFARTAERMRARGEHPERVAHFLTQCLFCFFAEDASLLQNRLFERGLQGDICLEKPELLQNAMQGLFTAMQTGGIFGFDSIPWFNGGLFAKVDVPPLERQDVLALRSAATEDWSAIDVSIFGTLFERGLDPSKRSQLGAHYTDPATIMRLIEPVVQRPLELEWQHCKRCIAAEIAKSKKQGDSAYRKAQAVQVAFLEKLREFRVLDPACGSGNFLFLALKALKDLEHQVNIEGETLGLQRQVESYTSPANVLGIELNEFAAELARVTVWIGELQWRLTHGYPFKTHPILQPLDSIEQRDALLDADGSAAVWPTASVVVGNPPFIGDKKMRAELGDTYTNALRAAYRGRVPGGADLVCFWFEQARNAIETQGLGAAGLVSTNSIRGGKNRVVLDAVCNTTKIFEAWSDQAWVNEGAAVRVSLVCFGWGGNGLVLDGAHVEAIYSNLTTADAAGKSLDTAQVAALKTNRKTCFMGTSKKASFDIEGQLARHLLRLPNAHGKLTSSVVKPWINGADLVRRPSDTWIIDFGVTTSESDASLFEAPFEHLLRVVKPEKEHTRNAHERAHWWLHARTAPDMRKALTNLTRYMATSAVAKHRLWVWVAQSVLPSHATAVVARADDVTFGILHSRFHELWSLRMCTWMGAGNDPRYTPTTCFETFPFPSGLSPEDTLIAAPSTQPAARIAAVAVRLNELRNQWLNPPEWTERVPEITPLGMAASPYPERILPKKGLSEADAQALQKRTLTNLYNLRPSWLIGVHHELDAAVAAAYGWASYSAAITDEEILVFLLKLNAERAAAQLALTVNNRQP